MKRLPILVLGIVILSSTWSGPALAAPPDLSLDPRTPLNLLLDAESVQKMIKLTAAQRDTAAALRDRVERRELSEEQVLQKLAELLRPEQLRRLQEASWQARRGAALLDSEVTRALELSDAQKRELKEIWSTATQKLRDDLAVLRFDSPESRRREIVRQLDQASERMLRVLTEKQQARFKTLQGAKSDLPSWVRPEAPGR
jgi:hypothetical protein